jgi:Winged helix DNA-binding domain
MQPSVADSRRVPAERSLAERSLAERSLAERLLAERLLAERLAAQQLSGEPAASPVDVVGRLLAVQGQDPRGARLAIRARTSGLTVADVDRAMTTDRSLVTTWLNRGTLHLVRSEDYWWLHQLAARPQFQVGCRRILARHGVSDGQADKGAEVVEEALVSAGPLTRAQLAERIARAGLPSAGGVALHIAMLASLRGVAVRGPVIGAEQAYVHVRDWLGKPPPVPDRDAALGWLARRYLAGHGPADDRDLAKWAGLTVGAARRGLAQISSELRERPDRLAELATSRSGTAGGEAAGLPAPRLLGAYDPVLLGWVSREAILTGHHEIVTVNGLFRPFALVEGRAAGIWAWRDGGVELEPFGELPTAVAVSLAEEARDVARFLGSPADQPAGGDDELA